MTLRRGSLWALLAAKLVGGWGVGWDIRWHLLIGRDSFWIAPHVMAYAAVAATAMISLGVLALETWRARRGTPPADAITVVGLTGTRGFHLAWWGISIAILAAPVDDLWHRLFGIDVTLWSPPHLLALAGSQVSNLGILLIALEVYDAGARRWAALVFGGVLLLGTFYITVDPSVQTAFHRGGVFFFTYAVLGALAFTFALDLVARVAHSRVAPLVLTVGALLVQLSIVVVGDIGFALLQPVPAIEEAIAADPTSPVAVAHEMARRNGTIPGRSLVLRLIPLIPGALMATANPSRRPRLAAVVFGLTLATVSAIALGRLPALSHALPSVGDTALALTITLFAALLGSACAQKLAGLMERYTRLGSSQARGMSGGRQAANRSSSPAGVSANIKSSAYSGRTKPSTTA
jgi:hypothetical protein